jgi:hypothetical protein
MTAPSPTPAPEPQRRNSVKEIVVNTYEQLRRAHLQGVPPVGIFSKYIGHRTAYFYGYAVFHLKEMADPKNTDWGDKGMKVFSASQANGTTRAEKKKACLKAAQEWASKKYGVKEWQQNRMRDSVPAPLNTIYPLRK